MSFSKLCSRAALATLACAALLLGATTSRAASILFDPASVSPLPGASFSLDLVITDLAGGDAGTVGGFDVALAFDAAAVSFVGVSFDVLLGTGSAEVLFDTIPGAGTLQIAGLSLLSPAALDALQSGSVRLATLVFEATAPQPSTISISSALVADALGLALPLDVRGSATVAPVPEPTSVLLFAVGLGVVARAGRRRTR